MAKPSITTRTAKGSPLSWAEGDANFTSLQQASVPNGGTTGQILAKSSNTNYDYDWVNPGSFQGIQGIQGITGAQGIQGYQGVQGSQGVQGRQGVTGFTGSQGVQGRQGSQGIQGIQGSSGPMGPPAPQGQAGSDGVQGLQGLQGYQGYSSNIFDYKIDTTSTVGDPGQGKIRYDNTDQINSIYMFISKTTTRSQVVTNYLKLLKLGSKFVIQDRMNDVNYQLWRVIGSISDYGTYIGFSISLIDSQGSGTGNFANLLEVDFGIDTGLQGIQGTQGVSGSQGIQGIQGLSGPSTSTTRTQPLVSSVGDQWFDPTTQILKVYSATGWVQVTADDLTF